MVLNKLLKVNLLNVQGRGEAIDNIIAEIGFLKYFRIEEALKL